MKRVLTVIGVLLLVLVVVGVALPFLVDINKFKDPILEKVREKTGEDIKVGRISWSAVPFLAVELEQFDLAGRQQQASLFRAKSVEVVLRWAPLLRKEVELKKIILHEPQLTVSRDAEGKISLGGARQQPSPTQASTDMSTQPETPAEESRELTVEAPPGKLDRVRLDSLQIVNGTVRYEETYKDGKKRQLELSGLDVSASDIAIGGKVHFKAKASLMDGARSMPFRVSGWIGPVDEETVRRAEWGGLPADIRFTADAMDCEVLAGFLPAETALKGQADVDLHVRRENDRMEYDIDFSGDKTTFRIPEKLRKPEGAVLRLNASGVLRGARLGIDKAHARVATAKIDIEKAFYDRNSHDFEGTVHAVAHLEDLMDWIDKKPAGMDTAALQGDVKADLEMAGNADRMADARMQGELRFDTVRMQWPGVLKRPVMAEGGARLQKDSISLNAMKFQVGKSDLSVDGKIQLRGSVPGQVNLQSRYLDIQECLDVLELPQRQQGPSASRVGRSVSAPAAAASPGAGVMKAQTPVGVTAGATASAAAATSGPSPSGMARWNLEGECKIGELAYAKNRLENVQGRMSLVDGLLTLSKFTAQAYQGTLSTALQLDLITAGMPFHWGIRMTDIEINDVIASNSNFGGRVYGKWNGQLELTGQAEGYPGGPLYSLQGAGQVKVFQMRIQTFDLMKNLSLLTGLLGMSTGTAEETRFEEVMTDVQVGGGRVATPNFRALAKNYSLSARGSFGFDQTIDYTAQVRLTPETASRLGTGQLVQALLASDGSMTIPFAVHGRLDGPPKFDPMWQDLLAREATHFLQRQLLRGTGGQTQQGTSGQASGTTSSQQGSGESTLEDLMLRLLKK